MSGRTVTVEERRARLGVRHRLAVPPRSVEELVDDLVVLHATDPATIYLSVGSRLADGTVDSIHDALFERRTLLRTLAMRRTLFVVTTAGAAAVEGSSSPGVAATERAKLERFLQDSDVAEPSRWLDGLFEQVLAALDDEPGGLQARELTKAVPDLGTRLVMGAGTRNAVEVGATSRVLGLLAVEGLLVRGRPTGDWTSRLYRWHRRDRWWPDAEDRPAVDRSEEEASEELLARWLSRFGPATLTDMKWWTGWTMTKTRRALAAIDAVEVEIELGSDDDGRVETATGYLMADDVEPVVADGPWASLLPSLDPTPMGWKDRSWYLGPHQPALFDRNGNIGPTVWVDGRIVGGWSQRPDGEVVIALLEPVGADQQSMIDAEVDLITRFVGPVVVKPSFPTPLQKKLSAG